MSEYDKALSWPAIDGLDTFDGQLWRAADLSPNQRFDGLRVALVGTGARAVQLLPGLQAQAAKVTVFQRSPRWVLAYWPFGKIKPLSAAPEAWLGRPLLKVLAAQRANAHLKRSVPERWARRQLTPLEPVGQKPVLIAPDWYRSLQASNVKLITWPIVQVCSNGIRSVEGIEHQFDVIILATGEAARADHAHQEQAA